MPTPLRIVSVLLAIALLGNQAFADEAHRLERLALTARLHPKQAEAAVRQIAESLQSAAGDKDNLQRRQGQYQNALLLLCDHDVIGSLSIEAREAVDDAIEAAIGFDEIRAGGWDRLAYVYGFFNHDVTPQQIEAIAKGWRNMTEAQRQRMYPPYPHLIDAVCKPLTVAGLADDEQTDRALRVAIPLLKEHAMGKPKPGRAFHPPTHAALNLGAAYNRWHDDPTHGPLIRELLGDRQQFEQLLTGRLIGAQPADSLDRVAVGFYAYTGRYFANTLARLDARSAVPTLRRSLEVYRDKGVRGSTVRYTQRALVALGDAEQRRQLEAKLVANPQDQSVVRQLVWLCRNGRGETVQYAQGLLAKSLGCEPAEALNTHFARRLAALGGPLPE